MPTRYRTNKIPEVAPHGVTSGIWFGRIWKRLSWFWFSLFRLQFFLYIPKYPILFDTFVAPNLNHLKLFVMAREIMLKFVDSSSSTCEVTGREKGDRQEFYVPLASLQCGSLDFENRYEDNHSVKVLEVGKDYVVVEVLHRWGGTKDGPYTIALNGKPLSSSYYFGEWSYSYEVAIICKE